MQQEVMQILKKTNEKEFKKMVNNKRLIEIANELKCDAEKILDCDLVLVQDSIKSSGNGFFPVARFADGQARKIENENFSFFNGKKCFGKKIGNFEYLLEITDLS